MDPKYFIGKIIDERFEIISIAGTGGMGTVYKARQIDLDRQVAIKLLDPRLVANDESLQRFQREAQVISRLNHQHIAAFYSYGVLDIGVPYIAMEFLEAESLAKIIGETKLAPQRVIKIANQIIQALGQAHSIGLIHRDLKPGNILIQNTPAPDYVKVVDFGLAKLTSSIQDSGGQKLTKTGELVGTPQYMSPEQCLGQAVDNRSDIYSLGIILYEMLTGTLPFNADNPMAIIHLQVHSSPKDLGKLIDSNSPEGLDLLVLKCLEKSADDRYQSVNEITEDLKKISQNQGENLNIELKSKSKNSKSNKSLTYVFSTVLAILVFSLAAFGIYYFGDSGVGKRAEVSLKENNSKDNVMEWLSKADKLDENPSKQSTAKQIFVAAEKALGLDTKSGTDAATAYLNLGIELLDRNKKEMASYCALKALDQLIPILHKFPKLRKHNIELYDKIGGFLLDTHERININQLRSICLTTVEVTPALGSNNNCIYQFRILADTAQSRQIPLTEELAYSLCIRDQSLASARNFKELIRSMALTTQIMQSVMGKNSPKIPLHYMDVADILISNKHPNDARKYLEEGEALLNNTSKDESKHEMDNSSGSWARMAALYAEIGLPGQAQQCIARSEVKSKNQSQSEEWQSNSLQAVALVEMEKYALAEKKAKSVLAQMSELNDAVETYKTRYLCVSALFQAYNAQNREVDAVKMLNTELSHAENILPFHWDEYTTLSKKCTFSYIKSGNYDAALARLRTLQKYANEHDRKIDSQVQALIVYCAAKKGEPDIIEEETKNFIRAKKTTSMERLKYYWWALQAALIALENIDGKAEIYGETIEFVRDTYVERLDAKDQNMKQLASVVNFLAKHKQQALSKSLIVLSKKKLTADEYLQFQSLLGQETTELELPNLKMRLF